MSCTKYFSAAKKRISTGSAVINEAAIRIASRGSSLSNGEETKWRRPIETVNLSGELRKISGPIN